MRDYRDAVDYFSTYKPGAWVNPDFKRTEGHELVKAVRINCKGDQNLVGRPKYQEISIARGNIMFHGEESPISRNVGLTVRVIKLPPDPQWKNNDTAGIYDNRAVTFLQLQCDDDTPGEDPLQGAWGWAPMRWQNSVGSVMVGRSDGRDVTRHEVEALCRFCQDKMQPIFETALEAGVIAAREGAMAHVTPKAFREYFNVLKKQSMAEDLSWAGAMFNQLD